MKTGGIKISMIILFIIVFGFRSFSQNQDTEKALYRVTAYKNGDNKVMSVSNTAEVTFPFYVYVPNAFTPDGDGLNDVFLPLGRGMLEYSMQVFDRWGELIYECDNSKGWDGYYMGKAAEPGVYVYRIVAKGSNERRIEKKGSVTIVGTQNVI